MTLVFLALLGCKDVAWAPGDTAADSPATDVDTTTTTTEASCPEDSEVFATYVWEPVLGVQCVGCHVEGGVAGHTAMVLDPDDMNASAAAVSAVVDVLLDKPTGLSPDGHGGGALVEVGSEAYEALAFWVDWTHGICDPPEDEPCPDALAQRRVWRLTHGDYDRAVQDLLGIDSTYGAGFTTDVVVDGHRNDAEALVVSSLLADQYRSAAEAIVADLDVDALLPCDRTAVGDRPCAGLAIEALGYRAFRRPMSGDELVRYVGLWEAIALDEGFDEGMRWAVAALLQSPHFLYRSELGVRDDEDTWALTDWELASQMSFLLWGSSPDDELLEAAAQGELVDPVYRDAQVDRLASDDRAHQTTWRFVEEWLQLDGLAYATRDGITDDLRVSMVAETEAVVEEVSRTGGSVDFLFDNRLTWVDSTMAAHYGLDAEGWVHQPDERDAGVLAHASVLTTHALPSGSSPIHRGVLVRERLLCEELPPPPANLDTSPPEIDDGLTTRERYAQHATDPACASCHDLIDPIGFGFEHYDGLGQWRAQDAGQPVDASGEVDGAAFDGLAGLTDVLLDDERFRSCVVSTWRRWGTGADACADDPGPGLGLAAPLLELTERSSFTHRVGEAGELDTLAIGERVDVLAVIGTHDVELPNDDLVFVFEITDDWGTGYCAEGLVTNGGTEPITWVVRTEIAGEIDSIWSARYELDGAEVIFYGDGWNDVLGPGGGTSFGLCATR